jgi:hypothetical protein
MLLDGLVFRLQHHIRDDWDRGDDCFLFYKTRSLVEQYARFWTRRRDFHARRILELGLWDAGSMVFWSEYFQPEKHVGIDIQRKQNSRYFRAYLASRGLADKMKTYWGTDQRDAQALRAIVTREFSDPLDLIIDDASHMYDLTKKSFETLFPLLRSGGLYVIEDWAWGHWREFQRPDHPWSKEVPLTRFIVELIEATGSSESGSAQGRLIESVTTHQGFAVVERGSFGGPELREFQLDGFISRRPDAGLPADAATLRPSWMRSLVERWLNRG